MSCVVCYVQVFVKAHVVDVGVPGRVYCMAPSAWSSRVLYLQAHVVGAGLLGCVAVPVVSTMVTIQSK